MSEQASTSAPSATTSDAAEREYLQQKYGHQAAHMAYTKQDMERMVDKVLESNETVKYLVESLRLGGCPVGRNFFQVAACNEEVGGGFSTDYGVIMCHNKLTHYREVELAMAHELVHAYDFCRAKNFDLTDCRHHACTEIRAANLSGDCSFSQELLRGNLSESIIGQQKRCVQRRALLSVSLNPYCQGDKAELAVNDMMGKCFKDTDPFPKIP